MRALSAFRRSIVSASLALLAFASSVRADAPLVLAPREQHRLVTDGWLADWASVTALHPLSDDVRYALAADDESLHIAVWIRDDTVVRTAAHGATDDVVVLTLAPLEPGLDVLPYEVRLWPGRRDAFAAFARVRSVRGAVAVPVETVECDGHDGATFALEARIPWSALAGLPHEAPQLRGRLAYEDHDGAGVPVVTASSDGDLAHAEALAPFEGAEPGGPAGTALRAFAEAAGLSVPRPVAQSAVPARGCAACVQYAVFPRQIVVVHAGGFAYIDHLGDPDGGTSGFVATPDPSGEFVALRTHRAATDSVSRELVEVFRVSREPLRIERVLVHEIGFARGDRALTDTVTFEHGVLRVTAPRPASLRGMTEGDVPGAIATDVIPALTPWSALRTAAYAWNAQTERFELQPAH